jgi:DNA polymerase V
MYSILENLSVLSIPLVAGKIPAGFPSPADDFLVKALDLNQFLITHPQATFVWQVSGHSMREAGIFDGDYVIVNRALKPVHGSVVVAQLDNDFTIKYFHNRAGRVKLVPANSTFPEITPREGQTLLVCGVVTAAIKRFGKQGKA